MSQQTPSPWLPAEPDMSTVLERYADPLRALANGDVPAIVLRNAYDPAQCAGLIQRFLHWGLMRDSLDVNSADKRGRIDIGTSLGNRGHDQAAFLEYAEGTHELFPHLFAGFTDPVKVIYEALFTLAGGQKAVKTAYEADGRRYGPAIFRTIRTTSGLRY